MKEKFNSNIELLLAKKAINTKLFSREVYSRIISEVKAAKIKQKKVTLDYRGLSRFDVIVVNGSEKLLQPVSAEEPTILYYLEKDELFDNDPQCPEQVIDDRDDNSDVIIQATSSEDSEIEAAYETTNISTSEDAAQVSSNVDTESIKIIEHKQKEIKVKRKNAHENLKIQGAKMLKISDKKFSTINVGDTVRIRVFGVDRGRGDPRSILGTVLETQDGFYTIGTNKGILKQLYCRSELVVCSEKLVTLNSVPKEEISLRQVSSAQSLTGGQGYIRCNCSRKCKSNRCKCKAKSLLCNSKCHRSTDCYNKFKT
ncbi:hypothetical protein ILUMI_14369 [Ignelater luminosus]|uniref:Uncharacterized protein n=1 Tax=Ignelater luminosus TaxID=2038154 RepID=A0A8K0CQM5_IGNLU|nr:hypothetical protein ILUMI_14369 [Ignelater luminosus]